MFRHVTRRSATLRSWVQSSDFLASNSMLPNHWWGDLYAGRICESLSGTTASVQCTFRCAMAHEQDTFPVSNAHEEVQIQCERLRTGHPLIATPVYIS
jgi:hypothetical protein